MSRLRDRAGAGVERIRTTARLRALAASTAALALAVSLAACTDTARAGAGGGRPLVVVTTNILGDVVAELAGDRAEVLTLMPPGSDPHSFEVSASEGAQLREAALVVANGLGLEEGLARHVESAAADGVEVFEAGDHLEVLDYADGTDAAGAADPHFWTDPARMTDVVEALGADLSALNGLDQTARAEVQANTTAYLAELAALDAHMTEAFAALPAQRRALVTNHHVFGYLADRFGFRVVGAVIPGGTTLAAPSASDLRELVAAVDEAGVPTIFAESSQPDRLVQVLAEEADRDVAVVELVTESLTAPSEGAPTYLTMMRLNTERIATGLSP
jgi:zinc/manganese transport system substrate-binding protein